MVPGLGVMVMHPHGTRLLETCFMCIHIKTLTDSFVATVAWHVALRFHDLRCTATLCFSVRRRVGR